MGLLRAPSEPFPVSVHVDRLRRAAGAAADRGLDGLLITPSHDYLYLLGYQPPALERLTCLVVPAEGQPVVVVPRLEESLAHHQLAALAEHVEIDAWDEVDDPFDRVRAHLGAPLVRVGVQDQMWARHVLRLRAVLDPAQLVEAGHAMHALRRRKSADEIARLRLAAEAADAAMRAIATERFSGRSEHEVSRRIADLLTEAGHDSADSVIVASGPNAASPHHEPGDRTIGSGDAVVLDFGGIRARYCSDTSRTAFVGEPPAEFLELHDVVSAAQRAACDAVRPGVAAEAVDAAARDVITEAGYGEQFVHRTGHGIGMEVHEEPYIVAGNGEPLEEGNAFSIEPGIYVPDRWGARIEDIVVCTPTGGERLNQTDRELILVD